MHPGMFYGLAGGIIGLLGGIIGTYFSIKNTDTPRERSFMIKASAVFWLLGIVFITLLLTIQSPLKWLLWLPYGFLFPLSIRYINNKLTQIKKEEAALLTGESSETTETQDP